MICRGCLERGVQGRGERILQIHVCLTLRFSILLNRLPGLLSPFRVGDLIIHQYSHCTSIQSKLSKLMIPSPCLKNQKASHSTHCVSMIG